MSKVVKELIRDEYLRRLDGVEDALVISLRGIDSNSTNQIRTSLRGKQIEVTTVRNNLFARTFDGQSLGSLGPVLKGSSAVAYGAESVVEVAREIVGLLKEFPDIELKGEDGVKALSKFPTRDEAIAKDISIILGPGASLLGAVKGPGSGVAGIIKAIEAKLEDGETISKVS